MKISIETAQWIGERERQEDSLAYGVGPDGRHLLVLTDGMGGHAGGDIASHLATSVALEAMLNPYDTIPEALSDAISRANSAIANHVESSPECDGMGTTLICAVIENEKLWWSSVGDSHLFLLRSGDVKKLNADHSMMPVLQKMVSEGEITVEQAASDPNRNALRSAVMGDEIPLIDLSKRPFDLCKGDIIILCSDGVDSIENLSSLEAAITSQNNARNAANNLIEAVKAIGRARQDNTSAIVARIGGERATIQLETQITEKPNALNAVRSFILPGITLALAVTTLWLAISSWNDDSALQKAQNQEEEIIAENSVLKEDLERANQAVAQLEATKIILDKIANAITDNDKGSDRDGVLADLNALKNDDISDQASSIIQFMIDILSKNQSNQPLIAEPLAEDQDQDALQEKAQPEHLSALKKAIENDTLDEFIEKYNDTLDEIIEKYSDINPAEIEKLVSRISSKQKPDSHPATTQQTK